VERNVIFKQLDIYPGLWMKLHEGPLICDVTFFTPDIEVRMRYKGMPDEGFIMPKSQPLAFQSVNLYAFEVTTANEAGERLCLWAQTPPKD